MRGALAASTRLSYESAFRSYQAFCATREWTPTSVITTVRVAEWFTALATSNTVSSRTMRTYRSALRTMHVESIGAASAAAGGNPLDDEIISRLLDGIASARAPIEPARANTHAKSSGITMQMVSQLAAHLASVPGDEPLIMLAACALAVSLCLRPSELLGSHANKERALRLSQFTFFAEPEGRTILAPSDHARSIIPDHARVTLLASKTAVRGRETMRYVATPITVAALWRWHLTRCADPTAGEQFFRRGARLLTTSSLTEYVSKHLAVITSGPVHFTGKAFRIGGASTLAAQGVAPADIARGGHWAAGSRVPLAVYADPASLRQREIAISRAMQ